MQSGQAEWVWAEAVGGEAVTGIRGAHEPVCAGGWAPRSRSREKSVWLPPGAEQEPLTGWFCDLFWEEG